MQQYLKVLNAFYTNHPALYSIDDNWDGFTWLNVDNAMQSSLGFLRRGRQKATPCVCAFNFTPVPVECFVVGLPRGGELREVFSSDDGLFGGGGRHSPGAISALPEEFAGHPFRAVIDLPPLSAVYFDYFEKEEGMTQ
jgi:1,4-alpha-glucan branching enzyme